MISVTLWKLSSILQGVFFGCDVRIDTVVTDTRKIIPGCLFVALKGKRFDAHDFVEQAKKAGAGALLVSRRMPVNLPQLVVQDTWLAFGKLAAWVRQQVPARIVALTGSSGKTSVKEMVASILGQCGSTLYTLGNLNNDIGVPMTLLRLTEKHKYAVIELSANNQGGIAWTAGLTCPEAALVNNLSESHLEGFGSLKGIAKEKGKIYDSLLSNGIAILNEDNNDWKNWKTIIGTRKTWWFSINNPGSDFSAYNARVTTRDSRFTMQTPFGKIDVLLPLLGRHNISNALAAAALSMAVGAPLIAIKEGISKVKSIPGRLFPILLAENKLLLDDTYNANIGSMTVAVQVLSKMPGYRVMVISDLAELGKHSEIYHVQIGNMTRLYNLDRVLSIGKLSERISKKSGIGKHFFDKEKLVAYLKILLANHPVVTILVKGSRSSSMEEIVRSLQEKEKC